MRDVGSKSGIPDSLSCLDSNSEFELFSPLDQYALREKKYDAYRAWVWLRTEFGPCNVQPKKTFRDEIKTALRCSDQKLARVLKSGMGIFWKESGDHMLFIGVRKILKSLGLENENIRITVVSGADLFTNPLVAKATMFLGAHPKKFPISRTTLKSRAGICKNTQIKYERLSETKVIPRLRVISIVGAYVPIKCYVPGRSMIRRDNEMLLVERRSNRYELGITNRKKKARRLKHDVCSVLKPGGNGRQKPSQPVPECTIREYRGVDLIYPPGQTIRPDILFDVVPW